MEEGLAGPIIGSANSRDSIENREAATRRPVKVDIQVGRFCEQGPYDIAVVSPLCRLLSTLAPRAGTSC
jgi:hypothetical protein